MNTVLVLLFVLVSTNAISIEDAWFKFKVRMQKIFQVRLFLK